MNATTRIHRTWRTQWQHFERSYFTPAELAEGRATAAGVIGGDSFLQEESIPVGAATGLIALPGNRQNKPVSPEIFAWLWPSTLQ